MSKYSFLDLAKDVLLQSKSPLLYQEIWEKAKELGLDFKILTEGKTPWQSLGARLFVDVRDNPKSIFIKVGSNPARFYLKDKSIDLPNNIEQIIIETEGKVIRSSETNYSERDLHPLVAYFAYTNPVFNKGKIVYTKTIFHEKSKKPGVNEWIHPDMVGFNIPIDSWNQVLLEFNDISDSNSIKLYSIEIKKRIDRTNYRECFFQTVSNSSWANESYLISAEIKQDDDLLAELERLSSSFGIGIVHLNLDDIDSSRIIFPSRYKPYLDWELMNKLCDQNSDFRRFVDNLTKDYKVKTIHPEQYDGVINDPESYIKKMKTK